MQWTEGSEWPDLVCGVLWGRNRKNKRKPLLFQGEMIVALLKTAVGVEGVEQRGHINRLFVVRN